jgi:hypothetical protein
MLEHDLKFFLYLKFISEFKLIDMRYLKNKRSKTVQILH